MTSLPKFQKLYRTRTVKDKEFWMPTKWVPPSRKNPYSTKYKGKLDRQNANDASDQQIIDRVKHLLEL